MRKIVCKIVCNFDGISKNPQKSPLFSRKTAKKAPFYGCFHNVVETTGTEFNENNA